MGAMSYAASIWSGNQAYRGPQTLDARQRVLAIGGVAALHALVVGVILVAQLKPPIQPPTPIITVSFVTEAAAAAQAPAVSQPVQPAAPTPAPQMIAAARPTTSPMTAPPMERDPPREAAPPAPIPSPAQPVSSAAAPAIATPSAVVTPPSFRAAYLNNPQPAYPQAALRRRFEGTVNLRVQVGTDGAPVQVLNDRSSGNRDLDTAALEIVKRRWKFAPAKQGDRAITAWVIVPMEFYLKAA